MVKEQGKTKETITAVGTPNLAMIVVKLNSGGVLLYSPVRVREDCDLGSWLKTLGPVKYVVLGSSGHTLMIPSVVKSFPNAKFVGSEVAWMKLNNFEGFPKKKPDFMSTNKQELEELNMELEPEGVKFYNIDGDCATSALVGIADKTALMVDLIYTIHGKEMVSLEKDDIDKISYSTRLFKWRLTSSPNSPNNALPPYRFWMMDPTCPMSALLPINVPKDGSASITMAASLREMLKEDIDQERVNI